MVLTSRKRCSEKVGEDKRGYIKNMDISKILGEEYIKGFLTRFKISAKEQERKSIKCNWDNLREERCPICHNKLKCTWEGDYLYCNGKKHKKRFYISYNKYNEIFDKITIPNCN